VFFYCVNLTGVTIPDSVTNIDNYAFYLCVNLTGVSIPNRVDYVGAFAFENCSRLSNVVIGNSVTNIGAGAFDSCDFSSVVIPGSVTGLSEFAFEDCLNLTSLYFMGDAPGTDQTVFYSDTNTTAYYLPGTTGWGNFSAITGLPVVLWNPQVQTGDGSFGVQNNQFGFNISGSSNLVIIVEACTDLSNPMWQPIQTNTLTSGVSYFSDPQWTNYPGRFYRLCAP
jgi:hypothetical protein